MQEEIGFCVCWGWQWESVVFSAVGSTFSFVMEKIFFWYSGAMNDFCQVKAQLSLYGL